MKQIKFPLLSLIAVITSCSSNPQSVLAAAQNKIQKTTGLNYNQIAFYPNPMGRIDTLTTSVFINKTKNNKVSYDFLIQSDNMVDEVCIGGEFKFVNHKDSVVKFFPVSKSDKEKSFIRNSRNVKYSPLTLLSQIHWKFKKDTLIDGSKCRDYYKIENDTIVNGNKIYTERHIFINTTSKLLQSFERRNYFKGKLNQTVIFKYSKFNLSNSKAELTYDFPSNYKSILFGKTNGRTLLKVGEKAPGFAYNDVQNKPFNLDNYHGKKVLLNFSIINCGYCKIALNHFNQKDYQFSNKLFGVYINPIDEKEDVVDYVNEIRVPFPVLADAKQIGELYGVEVYPTFFLIDENGIIEKVILGYNKEFLESLKT